MSVAARLAQLRLDYEEAHLAARLRVVRERDILQSMLDGRGETTTVAVVTDLSVDYADIDLDAFLPTGS